MPLVCVCACCPRNSLVFSFLRPLGPSPPPPHLDAPQAHLQRLIASATFEDFH